MKIQVTVTTVVSMESKTQEEWTSYSEACKEAIKGIRCCTMLATGHFYLSTTRVFEKSACRPTGSWRKNVNMSIGINLRSERLKASIKVILEPLGLLIFVRVTVLPIVVPVSPSRSK